MEELFVYALFMRIGFDVENEYDELLDKLFMNDPENSDYLELEILNGNISESIVYIFTHSDTESFDTEKFGKFFVDLLRRFYESTISEFCGKSEKFVLEEFEEKSYDDIWQFLPVHLQMKDPFYMLLYAGEPLSWGDVEHSKELYQKIFDYYKTGEE